MRASFLYIHSAKKITFCATFATLLSITLPPAWADWGGSVTGSASSTQIEQQKSSVIDQQYMLYTTGRPTSNIGFSLSGLYRHLQNSTDAGPYSWLTEFRPSGSLNWNLPLVDFRANGSYRSDRDELGTTKLRSGSASVYGQTNWTRLPSLFASSNWARNINDLDLIGDDTWTRSLSAGSSYSDHNVFANYQYTDILTRNSATELDRTSRSHSGRVDYSKSVAKRLLNFQTGYQISSRTEQNKSEKTGELLIPLQSSAGLYNSDLTPEFDALETSPGLADGLLEVPAGAGYDLGNGDAHNFGLDFGLAVELDHLHLYIDTLTASLFTWSIWKSSDNLSWVPVATNINGQFSSVFLRYEFSFPSIQTRFVKIAMSPQLLNSPIEVTELRGFVTSAEEARSNRTTDHRGSARLQFQPSRWVSSEVSGDILRQGVSLSSLAREEDGFQSSLRFDPANVFDLGVRYQWNRSHYTNSETENSYTSSIGAVVRSQWNRAISTSASADRGKEVTGKFLVRQNDRTRLEIRTLLLPALRVTSQFAYSEDERFDSPDMIYSRTISNSFEGEPTNRSQLSVSHRYETRTANVSAVRKYQVSVNTRASYRLTDTIHLTAGATASSDPVREDRAYDGIVSWSPTSKVSMSGSVNRIEGDQTENATQYSLQAIYHWSMRTEISASYSLNEREPENRVSSARLSLYSRF